MKRHKTLHHHAKKVLHHAHHGVLHIHHHHKHLLLSCVHFFVIFIAIGYYNIGTGIFAQEITDTTPTENTTQIQTDTIQTENTSTQEPATENTNPLPETTNTPVETIQTSNTQTPVETGVITSDTQTGEVQTSNNQTDVGTYSNTSETTNVSDIQTGEIQIENNQTGDNQTNNTQTENTTQEDIIQTQEKIISLFPTTNTLSMQDLSVFTRKDTNNTAFKAFNEEKNTCPILLTGEKNSDAMGILFISGMFLQTNITPDDAKTIQVTRTDDLKHQKYITETITPNENFFIQRQTGNLVILGNQRKKPFIIKNISISNQVNSTQSGFITPEINKQERREIDQQFSDKLDIPGNPEETFAVAEIDNTDVGTYGNTSETTENIPETTNNQTGDNKTNTNTDNNQIQVETGFITSTIQPSNIQTGNIQTDETKNISNTQTENIQTNTIIPSPIINENIPTNNNQIPKETQNFASDNQITTENQNVSENQIQSDIQTENIQFVQDLKVRIGDEMIDVTDTEGKLPYDITLQSLNTLSGQEASVEIPQDTILTTQSGEIYTGELQAPLFFSTGTANEISGQDIISVIRVGSDDQIHLEDENGASVNATLNIPVPGHTEGDEILISFSHDGETWESMQTGTVILINEQPFVSFPTNHFTLFALGVTPIVINTTDALNTGNFKWYIDGTTTGTTLFQDKSASKLNATGYNTVLTSTLGGQAIMSFNGTNKYIGLGTGIVSAYPFTISTWIKADTAGTTRGLVLRGRNGVNTRYYGLGLSTANKATILASNTTVQTTSSTTTISTGVWYHIVGVFASATSRTLYVNGVSEGTNTTSVTLDTTTPRWTIAKYPGTATNYFSGSIDEVRVYSGTLSAAQITQLYMEPATFTTYTGSSATVNLTGYAPDPRSSVSVVVSGVTYTGTNTGYGVWAVANIGPLASGNYDVKVITTNIYGKVYTGTYTGALAVRYSAPANTTGLMLWLDTSDGATIVQTANTVSQRNDKSGRGNNAVVPSGMSWLSPSYNSNGYNGYPTISFNNHRLQTSQVSINSGEAYTIIVVNGTTGTNNPSYYLTHATVGGTMDGLMFGYSSTTQLALAPGRSNALAGNASVGGWHIDVGMLDTTKGRYIRRDGTLLASDTNKATPNTGQSFAIGGGANVGGFVGTVGEILVYNGTLTDAQRIQKVCSLASKWSISVSGCAQAVQFIYSPDTATTGSVTATITGTTSPITVLNNSGSASKLFTGNGSFEFMYKDQSNITGYASAVVYWITTGTIGTLDMSGAYLTINSGDAITPYQTVNLNLYASGATQMKIAESITGLNSIGREAFTGSKQRSLSSGETNKTIYALVRGADGKTGLVQDNIEYKSFYIRNISIDSGNISTSSTNVTLTTDVVGATQMRIANTTGALTTATREAYVNNRQWWAITNGDGPKVIYIEFKDAQGRTLSGYDDIIYHERPEYKLIFASYINSPVISIDGTKDTLRNGITTTGINNFIDGTNNNTGNFSVFWDDNYIYLFATVNDTGLYNDSTSIKDDDSVELYLDIGANGGASYDSNDYEYIFGWNDTTVTESRQNAIAGVVFSGKTIANGYTIEAKIPRSTVGIASSIFSGSKLIGMDVQINNDANGGVREGTTTWNSQTNNIWNEPKYFGGLIVGRYSAIVTPTMSSLTNDGPKSAGTSITFTSSGSNPGGGVLTYLFYTGSCTGTPLQSGTNATFTYTMTGAGTTTIYATLMNTSGTTGLCLSSTGTWTIPATLDIFAPISMTTTNVISSPDIQEQVFINTGYFQVADYKGLDSGWYTTISATQLTGANGSIPASLVSMQATGITLLSGTSNTRVSISSAVSGFVSLDIPRSYIKRDTASNSSIKGTYGNLPNIKIQIPSYQAPGTYQGQLIYTIYEN